MNISGLFDRPWLMRIVIVVWLVSAAFASFMLYRLNSLVHGTLYEYGLQFDYNWALPYWNFERVIYIYLAIPSVLGAIVLAWDLLKKGKSEMPIARRIEAKPLNGKAQAIKDNSMLISCPKCRKVFGKPLNMLDFSSGKTRLVNVCPYCNHILGNADKENSDENNVRVAHLDEETVEEEQD